MSSFALSTTPSVSSMASDIEGVSVECGKRGHPVERLGHTGNLVELDAAQLVHERGNLPASCCAACGTRAWTIAISFSNDGYSIH